MTTINGPSQKLEECYQNELRTLLKLKSNQPELSEDGLGIPQSAVSTQNTLMDKRLLLKELDYQIKQEKQKQELLLMQKNLSSIPLPGSCSSCRMQNWCHEMYLYEKTWNGSYSDARYFFDLNYDTNSLSFGSRYHGICLRIFIKKSILSK
nr:uncharacterized protein LOC108949455 [Phallusia mammillata]